MPILVICSDNPIMPPSRQVWTTCKCGKEIVHDANMEARVRQNHPGQDVEWSCIGCNASRLLDPAVVRQMLRDTRENLPGDLRARLAGFTNDEALIREIARLVPQ